MTARITDLEGRFDAAIKRSDKRRTGRGLTLSASHKANISEAAKQHSDERTCMECGRANSIVATRHVGRARIPCAPHCRWCKALAEVAT